MFEDKELDVQLTDEEIDDQKRFDHYDDLYQQWMQSEDE